MRLVQNEEGENTKVKRGLLLLEEVGLTEHQRPCDNSDMCKEKENCKLHLKNALLIRQRDW